MHFSSARCVVRETSYISLDDRFAAMQIDLCVRGWIGAFATLAAYAIPISSRTMCAQSSESEYYSPKRTANIIRL